MWTPTIELDALQKLEVLEKEWLPIVIERSYRDLIIETDPERSIKMFMNKGILPIWRTEPIGDVFDEVKTFDDYLMKIPLITSYDQVRKNIWDPSKTYIRHL